MTGTGVHICFSLSQKAAAGPKPYDFKCVYSLVFIMERLRGPIWSRHLTMCEAGGSSGLAIAH